MLGCIGDAQGPEREGVAAQDDRPDQQLARCAVRRAGNGGLELEAERAVQPARVLGARGGGMTGAECHDLHTSSTRVRDHGFDERAPGTATACIRVHGEPAEVRGLPARAEHQTPPRTAPEPSTAHHAVSSAMCRRRCAFQSGASAIGAPNSASTDRATARHPSTSALVDVRTSEPA